MGSYADAHESYLSVRLLIQGLLAVVTLPSLPTVIATNTTTILTTVLNLIQRATELEQEKQQFDEMGNVDYDELMERIQGEGFRDNDWGFEEDADVDDAEEDDLRDVSLKHLEALSGMEGDCTEIDDHLVNEITQRNVFVAYQQAMMVG